MSKVTSTLALALATFSLTLAWTVPAAAVTPSAIYDVDAAGNNPYREMQPLPTAAGACTNGCAVHFAAVPAGKRLVIRTVSCYVLSTSKGTTEPVLSLTFTGGSTPETVKSFLSTTDHKMLNSTTNLSMFGADTLLVLQPGESPEIKAELATAGKLSTPAKGACSLFGAYAPILP